MDRVPDFLAEAEGVSLSIFERTWSLKIKADFPDVDFSTERVRDDDAGDLGLRVVTRPAG